MTDVQKFEIARYRKEIDQDVRKLVDHYLSISDWDIPEVDEKKAIDYILIAIRESLDAIEKEWRDKSD
ncbi:hypothetical protein [Thiolapillus brandeum]|uniref:Uncharacterized protein n=1 Tax=Thiolapillus brandeum TaxID=1076588 RepID=A0A7U6JIL8_9GAMM|nr:hypothetical protein [Thiolapillus brandeum]BAO44365.1 conserved hypothetical protein [Thiolapillus brandeum]